jgi:hypothetical protein
MLLATAHVDVGSRTEQHRSSLFLLMPVPLVWTNLHHKPALLCSAGFPENKHGGIGSLSAIYVHGMGFDDHEIAGWSGHIYTLKMCLWSTAPFSCADKPAEKHYWLICCERKILFRLKKKTSWKIRIISRMNRIYVVLFSSILTPQVAAEFDPLPVIPTWDDKLRVTLLPDVIPIVSEKTTKLKKGKYNTGARLQH